MGEKLPYMPGRVIGRDTTDPNNTGDSAMNRADGGSIEQRVGQYPAEMFWPVVYGDQHGYCIRSESKQIDPKQLEDIERRFTSVLQSTEDYRDLGKASFSGWQVIDSGHIDDAVAGIQTFVTLRSLTENDVTVYVAKVSE